VTVEIMKLGTVPFDLFVHPSIKSCILGGMATLNEYFEEDCQSDDSLEAEIDSTEELDWQFLSAAQMPDAYCTDRPVDGELLPDAVNEIKQVCLQAQRLLTHSECNTLSGCSNYFLDSISSFVYDAAQAGSTIDNPVSGADLINFIRTLATLSFYRVTPTNLFKLNRSRAYPLGQQCNQASFKKILKSLNSQREQSAEYLSWNSRIAADEGIRRTERAFTQASSRIAYIPGQTIVSLDDDQYRLRSALSEAMGFSRINNPKKAFGIVSTNAVSLVSSMVIGMRLIGKGESFDDVVRVILMWMQGVDLASQVRVPDTLICLDRGYLGPSLIEFLLNAGFSLLGTHKRVNSYPYTFGNARNRFTQRVVEEIGCKNIYVAKKKFGDKILYAVAYRSGKGRVATLICSNPRLGMSERGVIINLILLRSLGLSRETITFCTRK
jgi:hypothetical protein